MVVICLFELRYLGCLAAGETRLGRLSPASEVDPTFLYLSYAKRLRNLGALDALISHPIIIIQNLNLTIFTWTIYQKFYMKKQISNVSWFFCTYSIDGVISKKVFGIRAVVDSADPTKLEGFSNMISISLYYTFYNLSERKRRDLSNGILFIFYSLRLVVLEGVENPAKWVMGGKQSAKAAKISQTFCIW